MSRFRSAIHAALSRLQFLFVSALLNSVAPCPEVSFIAGSQPHLHALNNSSHNNEELMATNSPSTTSVASNLLLFSQEPPFYEQEN